eukprot:CAMPEP_0170467116 /NCGR_PEP_ID=MMETSP0123-20130129/10813_1 /TAXON_ID=182087 /ORGANISM="Favella ehrenbergii, Strain Fehren 1" /LENGTH=80 /DNA_ID=CAMNT_0010733397 /DNA_START=282 /DNA_END=524 /DNA_ORIENTATION=-
MERTSLVSGLDFVADLTDLQQKVSGSDLVVTGEGSFDLQTLQGKAVAQIIDTKKTNTSSFSAASIKSPNKILAGNTQMIS